MRARAPLVEIVYFDAGGGHRTAARALDDAIRSAGLDWQVELVQLQRLLQSLDPIYQIARLPSEELYNAALKRGWTYGSKPFLRMVQKAISLEAPAFKRWLRSWWAGRKPDLVVSVVPNFNRVMFEALQLEHPATPFVTIMTDMADTPPRFWMEPQDQYLVCGTRKARLQAALSGFYRPERVYEVSGMIIRPRFYRARETEPMFTREALGFDPRGPVALVMFGGNGSAESTLVIEQLRACGVACILMCGRNEKLVAHFRGHPGVCAVPYTEHVEEYMRVADFFVGKPGPASISEALFMGLPVIVANNARTMIQERYNVTWVEEQGVGIGIDSYHQLSDAVTFLLGDNRLAAYRRRAALYSNRAVFEIVEILQSLLGCREASRAVPSVGDHVREVVPT